MDNQKILRVSLEAAEAAGKYLKKFYGGRPQVEFKGEVNLVTQCDRESQEIISGIIKKHFPTHSILGEEDLNVENDKTFLWVIDPIDGTINFAHSLPLFSISIAFMLEGQTQVGVVYVPLLDEMFHTIRGSGACLNRKPIAVSGEHEMVKCLLATGFPYDRQTSEQNNVNHFNQFILKCRDIRRMGSAAIDLCYTAAGRFDGYWELKLYPWDTAAACLMVLEAGGMVTDFSGNPFDPFMKECLASNGQIHAEMLDILHRSPIG
ncbi:MAG: inositol monophosphatase family protein [Candidatus Omnitrophota bacterium]